MTAPRLAKTLLLAGLLVLPALASPRAVLSHHDKCEGIPAEFMPMCEKHYELITTAEERKFNVPAEFPYCTAKDEQLRDLCATAGLAVRLLNESLEVIVKESTAGINEFGDEMTLEAAKRWTDVANGMQRIVGNDLELVDLVSFINSDTRKIYGGSIYSRFNELIVGGDWSSRVRYGDCDEVKKVLDRLTWSYEPYLEPRARTVLTVQVRAQRCLDALRDGFPELRDKANALGGGAPFSQGVSESSITLTRGTAVSLSLPLGNTSLPKVIGRIISGLLGVVGGLALLFFVYGGVIWMTAAGNPDKVKQGKGAVFWAAIGLVAVFASYAVLNFIIGSFTG